MNLIVDEKKLQVHYDDNRFLDDKIIFYFNKFWDKYEKIIVLKSIDIEEYAILLKGIYCDIPKIFNKNNKIVCYIIGIDKNENKIQTNKITIERKK